MCPQRRPLLTPQGAVRAAGWGTARINASSLGSCASGIRAGVPAPQVHRLPPILVSVGPDFSRVGVAASGGTQMFTRRVPSPQSLGGTGTSL